MKRRDQILQEIAQLIFENGYEKTSIREISKSLNISKPGLYYHFESKQEMLFAIIDDFMDKTLVLLHEAIERYQTPHERLYAFIQNHIQSFVKYPAQTKVVIYEIHSLNAVNSKKLKKKQMEYLQVLKKELIAIMAEAGSEMDISATTFCLMGTLNWIIQWYKPKGRVGPDQLARDIWIFFLKGLGVKPSKISKWIAK